MPASLEAKAAGRRLSLPTGDVNDVNLAVAQFESTQASKEVCFDTLNT